MKTLAQIRAQNALVCIGRQFNGAGDGEVIKKMPIRILQDGLLTTLAFCHAKGGGHADAAQILVGHLAHRAENGSIAITTSRSVADLIRELAAGDSHLLRRATAEALELLNYMKRFAE